MIKQLVVNGCSYMEVYALGDGHKDLSDSLNISTSASLAIGGSANSRIIRTTLKHSYQTNIPTFYVLGMTFLSRNEIPILNVENEFEGMWTNPQNQQFMHRWQSQWTQHDTDLYIELKLKAECYSIPDRLEDLMFRLVSMATDLQARGHRVLVFQQADNIYQEFLDSSRFDLFRQHKWIVEGYDWRSIAWQHNQGVSYYKDGSVDCPPEIKHRKPRDHFLLNQYLINYINSNNILD